MELNERISWLMTAIAVRYGDAWLRKWDGVDPQMVRADWSRMVGAFSDDAIRYALEFLPIYPPNASEFRAICLRAPAKELPRLAAPKADPDRAKAMLAKAYEAIGASPPGKRDRSGDLTISQKELEERKRATAERVAEYAAAHKIGMAAKPTVRRVA